MPRQSRQCCQQIEGKVPSHGEASGAQKNLIRFSSLICLDCPTLVSAAMTKTSCSKTPLPVFVYRNKTEPAQGKQPKEPYSCAGREGTFPSTHTTFVMGRHRTFLTGVLTVQDCQFHLSDVKSHKPRIPMIHHYPDPLKEIR